MLQAAQQQHQWELDVAWQQQEQQQQQQQGFTGASALALTEQPSEQWRALQELGSAQHLLAALESSPTSAVAATAGPSPRAAAAALGSTFPGAASHGGAAAAAVLPRPSLHSRGIGPMPRSPGLVSPCSSLESPLPEGFGLHSPRQDSWGSRIPTRPTSSHSWQGQQQPQQQQKGLAVDPAAGAQLGGQDSFLERSNPMQTPAGFGQAELAVRRSGNGSRGSSAPDEWHSGQQGAKVALSAPTSPVAYGRQSLPASPAASEPASAAHSAAAASIGSMVGPCRVAVSRTLQGPGPQRAAAEEAALQQLAAAGQPEYAASPHRQATGSVPGSPGATLRKSVCWADREQQQQHGYQHSQPDSSELQTRQQQQQPEHAASPAGSAAAGGQLFAEDLVPGACSMYSPYVPASRQQLAALQGQELSAAAAPAAAPDGLPAGQVRAAAAADGRQGAAGLIVDSPVPLVSPAYSTVAEPASEAAGAMELSDLSGLSNTSPSSVKCGGQATPPHSMNFNVLYSMYGEARSDHSDSLSGHDSNPSHSASASVQGRAYETRDMSRARAVSAGRGPAGQHGGSPGAQKEISFALQGASPGSPGSSLGESAAWLTAAGCQGQRASRGVAGILGMHPPPQMQQQALQHGQGLAIPLPQEGVQQQQQPQQQQDERQLLWDLLQSDEDNMQMDSPSSGPSAAADAPRDCAGAGDAAAAQALGYRASSGAAGGAAHAAAAAQLSKPMASQGAMEPAAAAAFAAATADMPAVVTQGAGAVYCGSSRGSFSSSMDLSPVKRQLFRSVSHSCQSLLQGAAGLSSMAAQLDAAAGAAASHGSREAAQASRHALMAKQQRQELHQRVQQGGGLSQQLAACPEHQQHEGGVPCGPITLQGSRVSVSARRALSSSAETASSWAASSITPYVTEATAAAEAALAAAEAAAQLSTSCPAALTMRSCDVSDYGSLLSESDFGSRAPSAAAQAADARAGAATTVAAQVQGVLMGLTPVVPGATDRPPGAQAVSGSPAASDPSGSPRTAVAHGHDAVAKALFQAPGSAAAAAAGAAAPPGREVSRTGAGFGGSAAGSPHTQRREQGVSATSPVHHQQQRAPLASLATSSPERADARRGLFVVMQAQGTAGASSAPASPALAGGQALPRAAASSLPASPAPAAAVVGAAGASSLPVSPAAAAPGTAAVLDLRRSSLGPRSTAALAELQSQLLAMAVEKAALQRQLQHGRTEVEKLQEKVSFMSCIPGTTCQQYHHVGVTTANDYFYHLISRFTGRHAFTIWSALAGGRSASLMTEPDSCMPPYCCHYAVRDRRARVSSWSR